MQKKNWKTVFMILFNNDALTCNSPENANEEK